jgi:hypothetical protein
MMRQHNNIVHLTFSGGAGAARFDTHRALIVDGSLGQQSAFRILTRGVRYLACTGLRHQQVGGK